MRTFLGSTKRSSAFTLILLIAFSFVATALSPTPSQARQKYAGIVMDAKTGKILYSSKADSPRYPASLTKMMTLYMLFDAMERGKVKKSTRIRVSKHAASMQPSKLGIKAGGSIKAEHAIRALVTKSANDIAAAVAEHLGRTESNFAAMMTKKARSIGMSRTTFKNASGLPNSKQVTTARDMARLGIALREHFPRYYKYFGTRTFKYGRVNYRNHNRLLGRITGVDGIKTGYTRASGYNLVSSVAHRKRSIVAVVLGGRSGKSRNAQMTSLIRKYLSKASTGRDKIVVAKGRSNSVFASVFGKKTKKASPSHLIAYADPNLDKAISSVEQQMASLSVANIPVPTRNPAAVKDTIQTASIAKKPAAKKVESAKPTVQASNEPKAGWQIQIGAVPTKENALEFLASARKVAPKTLKNVSNYTMQIEKNGGTLYRARFAGFDSKNAAWKACKALKKKFSCLALAN